MGVCGRKQAEPLAACFSVRWIGSGPVLEGSRLTNDPHDEADRTREVLLVVSWTSFLWVLLCVGFLMAV